MVKNLWARRVVQVGRLEGSLHRHMRTNCLKFCENGSVPYLSSAYVLSDGGSF